MKIYVELIKLPIIQINMPIPLEELLETSRGLEARELKARNFRARLLGLIYEDILELWFKERRGYSVLDRDVRRGRYKDRRVSVDFVLEKGGKLYVVEAKCWPAYNEGLLKKLSLNTLNAILKEFKTTFLKEDFLEEYELNGRKMDGKILVWWDVEEAHVEELKVRLHLYKVISLKRILRETASTLEALKRIKGYDYERWAGELFEALKGGHP